MNSNLHLSSLLLPIGAMNVISILPLLLLAPLIEFLTTCYLSMEKTPLAPAKVISEYSLRAHVPTEHILLMSSPKHPCVCVSLSHSTASLILPLSSCNCPAAPSLITPPCPSSPSSSGPRVCHSVRPGGRFVRAAEEGVPAGGADSVREGPASVVHAVFPAGSSVHPAGSRGGPRHPCM